MSKFELLKHEMQEVVEHTYIIQDGQGKIVYKEWMDSSGNVMDFTLRDKDGYEIDDFGLLEQVHEFIESLSIEP